MAKAGDDGTASEWYDSRRAGKNPGEQGSVTTVSNIPLVHLESKTSGDGKVRISNGYLDGTSESTKSGNSKTIYGATHQSSHVFRSLDEYPVDPYQIKVPRTTTSLIFSKYGPPIHFQTFLDLVARAQYQIIRAIIAAHGDQRVPGPLLVWSEKKLCIHIGRPLARLDLTWQMVADTLEGLRIFFDRLQGWFETAITILDDSVGVVGDGGITYSNECP
ncbi:MAG: hypothetical protein Q9196_005104 [Gyalolechia fulgens]